MEELILGDETVDYDIDLKKAIEFINDQYRNLNLYWLDAVYIEEIEVNWIRFKDLIMSLNDNIGIEITTAAIFKLLDLEKINVNYNSIITCDPDKKDTENLISNYHNIANKGRLIYVNTLEDIKAEDCSVELGADIYHSDSSFNPTTEQLLYCIQTRRRNIYELTIERLKDMITIVTNKKITSARVKSARK